MSDMMKEVLHDAPAIRLPAGKMEPLVMAELRTFVFTDIVRSVGLKGEMSGRNDTERDRAFIETVLTPHRDYIDGHLQERGGRIVSTAGDGHFLVFADTSAAALWAVEVQRLHRDQPITTPQGSRVEVRISVHVGVPQIDPRDPNNFVGKPVDYAARLNDFAQGGQVLVSRAVAAILEDVQLEGVWLHSHGQRTLKGIGRVEVYEVVYGAAGPQETHHAPLHNEKREWTIIPPPSAEHAHPYRASAPPGAGSAVSTVARPIPTQRLGNYELGDLLGSGGMGDVYKARHIHFDRVRAVKVIKQRFVDAGQHDLIRRFYQEIRAAGKLDHHNIVVAVESSSPDDPVHFLVMEYIDGLSFDELVTRNGPLNVADACESIRQAACGLQMIHHHGMVHRDIKPSNLMLTTERNVSFQSNVAASAPVVKILDLGLALLVDENQERLTHFSQRGMGTGMYMSPEQWKSATVDIRADIYSLGCTFYHLLAGHPPFLESDLKPEKAHEKSKVPPIEGSTRVPRAVWEIIRKMLSKEPNSRYQMPGEVALALEPYCEAQQLVTLLQRYQHETGESSASIRTQGTSAPHIDTLPLESDSPASNTKPSRRKVLTVLATLLAVLGFGFAISALRDPPVARSDRFEAIANLVLPMPGMQGSPWFEEVPWLFPEARVRLLAQLKESDLDELDQFNSDVAQVEAKLLEVLQRDEGATTTNWTDAFYTDEYQDVRMTLAPPFDPISLADRSRIPILIEQLSKISAPQRLGTEWHLLGVLQSKAGDLDFAVQSLRQAIGRYSVLAPEGKPQGKAEIAAQMLMALARSDLAQLQITLSQAEKAQSDLETAIELLPPQHAPLARVYNYGMLSLALLPRANVKSDDIFSSLEAAQFAADEAHFTPNHPLRAFLLERQAHVALETWNLEQAVESAKRAYNARDAYAGLNALYESYGSESSTWRAQQVRGNHHAQQAWFRARQIEALASHFQGVQDSAIQQEKFTTRAWQQLKILNQLLSQFSDVKLTDAQLQVWLELQPNFRGRQADCEFFTMGQFAEAADTMELAITSRVGETWNNDPEKRHFLVFMRYKWALANLLSNYVTDKELGLKILDETEPLAAAFDVSDPRRKRFELFRQVARQMAVDMPVQFDQLHATLQKQVPVLEERPRDRDNRQLMIFVAAYLKEMTRLNSVEYHIDATEQDFDGMIRKLMEPLGVRSDKYRDLVVASAAKAAQQRMQTRDTQ